MKKSIYVTGNHFYDVVFMQSQKSVHVKQMLCDKRKEPIANIFNNCTPKMSMQCYKETVSTTSCLCFGSLSSAVNDSLYNMELVSLLKHSDAACLFVVKSTQFFTDRINQLNLPSTKSNDKQNTIH